MLLKDGVVSTLLIALNAHKDDQDVALGACGTFANLAITGPFRLPLHRQYCEVSSAGRHSLTVLLFVVGGCAVLYRGVAWMDGTPEQAKEEAKAANAHEVMKAMAKQYSKNKAVRRQADLAMKRILAKKGEKVKRRFSFFGMSLG